jgi:hypothetical protein
LKALALSALLALSLPGPALPAPMRDAEPLQPFVATYQVFNAGRPFGEATMQVRRDGAGRWRIDLDVRGNRGLLGLAGLNVQQSTWFEAAGDGYRPLSQATVRRALFRTRSSRGRYDWQAGSARWQGDVKRQHQAAIALQPGDMSGLLINLALIRDAAPGKQLDYRFVDDGRVRQHRYQVAGALEPVAVGELGYQAMRVDRLQSGGDETVLWVAAGVPTPIRLLQREHGADGMDLRLIDYQGAQ